DWIAYHMNPHSDMLTIISIYLSIVIGGITFTGSLVAWGKLSERIPGKPILFAGQRILTILLITVALGAGYLLCSFSGDTYPYFLAVVISSLLLGIFLVIPIGGADMPVVISVLNSYSGIVACTTGFVIRNTLLIVAGSLVGANGIILSIIMCK